MIDPEEYPLPQWQQDIIDQRYPKPKAPRKYKKRKKLGATGIYVITNTLHDKHYIGKSTAIETRWRQHKTVLRNNKSSCKEMQDDWNAHSQHFKMDVIRECSALELNKLEREIIHEYITADKILYNYIHVVEKQTKTIVNIKKEH